MSLFPNYPPVETLQGSDSVLIWQSSNYDTRRASVSQFSDFVISQLQSVSGNVTQYAAPNASGFSISVSSPDKTTWLIITPAAGYAAGTIVLPAASGCLDMQEVIVNCTQSVTTLTVSANGAAAVYGAPTTLVANGFFTLRFDKATTNWYRIG